jgi:hypothetical protein
MENGSIAIVKIGDRFMVMFFVITSHKSTIVSRSASANDNSRKEWSVERWWASVDFPHPSAPESRTMAPFRRERGEGTVAAL